MKPWQFTLGQKTPDKIKYKSRDASEFPERNRDIFIWPSF